ncbi:MAG TPA: hypothetical protein VHV55_03895 [Pirellulales bacterium]|nr:hypothetical protein [Pirellulales bacterium]
MKRTGSGAAAALLTAFLLLAPESAGAWPWTKAPAPPAGKPAAQAPTSNDTEKPANKADQAKKLKKAAKSVSQSDKAAAKRTSPPSAKPAWSPANSRYRWTAAQQPSPARRAVTSTVNVLTLKPLRDKLSGNPTTHNPWTRSPPVTNTSANKRPGMLGSIFKPKPPKKTGPQTVGEWIQQDRPGF